MTFFLPSSPAFCLTFCLTFYLTPILTCSPPARWGLLDFMSVACSSPPLLSSSCSTATLDAQCSLSDLNHDHPRPVFPAGPQPRPSPPSVPCRTSTTTIHAQCSLPDLNREYPRQVFPAGPHIGRYGTKNVQKKVRKNVRQVWLVSVMFLQTCLTGGVLTCWGMFVCLAQVVHWPVWSRLSKPVESSGVYFTWPTDMFISCLTDWHAQWPARWNKWLG